MPSPAALWMGVLVSLWVFVLAEAWRLVVFSGQSAGLAGVLSVLKAQLADFSITRIIATVAYRLSTALDRYVLIVDAHLFAHSTAYAVSFASYLVRSFLNLVLPGTPYLDAYTPSSNLLPLVLTGQPLVGAATKAELIVSLNTQPYTMYGVAVLLLGKGAPFLIFTMTAAVGLFYRMVHSVSARLALMYLFFAGIHVYGFEVAAANAIHLAVSLYIFIWLMRGWLVARGWFVVRKAAPAVEALAREDTWGTSTH
jgi:hypothetical protein